MENRKKPLLRHVRNSYIRQLIADVAELADALDSKSGTRESVWVRPPPSAPLPQVVTEKT